jgi:hypothetical protein
MGDSLPAAVTFAAPAPTGTRFVTERSPGTSSPSGPNRQALDPDSARTRATAGRSRRAPTAERESQMSEGQSFFDKAKDMAGDMKDKVSDMLDSDPDSDQEDKVDEAKNAAQGAADDVTESMPNSDLGQSEPPH